MYYIERYLAYRSNPEDTKERLRAQKLPILSGYHSKLWVSVSSFMQKGSETVSVKASVCSSISCNLQLQKNVVGWFHVPEEVCYNLHSP